MAVSYKKLFKLLIDKEMSGADLKREANLSPNTLTKLRKNEYVALEVLDRVCSALNVDYGSIVEHIEE